MSADVHHALAHPSAWIARFARLIPDGDVLDLACGGGRHARLLAHPGRRILALDRDEDALAQTLGTGIETMQFDLEAGGSNVCWPFEQNRFAGIVVANYLHRPLFPFILKSVVPSGILLYETFAHGNERFGKPSNPDFLLAPGELLAHVQSDVAGAWRILAYEDGYVDLPKPAMVQRICAVKNISTVLADSLRLI